VIRARVAKAFRYHIIIRHNGIDWIATEQCRQCSGIEQVDNQYDQRRLRACASPGTDQSQRSTPAFSGKVSG